MVICPLLPSLNRQIYFLPVFFYILHTKNSDCNVMAIMQIPLHHQSTQQRNPSRSAMLPHCKCRFTYNVADAGSIPFVRVVSTWLSCTNLSEPNHVNSTVLILFKVQMNAQEDYLKTCSHVWHGIYNLRQNPVT